ncbi:MAG TPA: VIT1/CCC1 transporter family protein [Chlamydiales bacterium]|nr:VIT1/CCC1 transporter family protein [Chlamydiales bacterium]
MDTRELPLHFKGKEAIDHVIDARIKGRSASSETHGAELPGHYSAAADAAKETTLILMLFWILFSELNLSSAQIHWISLCFMIGWLFWKVGRSAILGYSRLERLHRLIEEERWEIEHHRPQEREELKALYAAKGFSGKLLEESIDILMADDNRLLQVMLEEELGLSLESYEHPLKQALGAFCGVLTAGAILFLSFVFLPWWGTALTAICLIALFAGAVAHLEKNRLLHAIVWNIASAALSSATAWCAAQGFIILK